MLDLSSVTAKLGRAEYHANAIKEQTTPWLNPDLYGITQEANADFTRYRLIFHIKGDGPPLERWSLMSGDCVHNLRSALDHLVYAVAIRQSKKNPPPCCDFLQFPICDTFAAFEKDTTGKRSKLGEIRRETVAVFERLQPYKRFHPVIPPLLSIIRNFDNTDKHRLLRPAFGAVIGADIGFCGPDGPPDNIATVFPNYGELKDGAEIVEVVLNSSTPNMQFDRHEIGFHFAVYHGPRSASTPPMLERTALYGLLSLLIDEVRFVVDDIQRNVG